MRRTLRTIFDDLLAFRNIETYVTVLIAVVVIVLSLVQDVVPLNIQMAVLLAAVALLVLKSATQERRRIDLDDVLQDRQDFRPLREFIRGGRTLWVYGASAVNVIRSADEIKTEILDRGGELRVLMQDPNEIASLTILEQQLDKIHDLRGDIQQVHDTLGRLLRVAGQARIEHRLLPYSPGFSMIIVDPEGRDGRLVVEFYGYSNEQIKERMHIEIHRDNSQHWFDYWKHQYEVMWDSAHPPAAP
jgi:Ca2+/Na+ antiporter